MSIKPDHDHDFHESGSRLKANGDSIAVTLSEEDKTEGSAPSGDRAMAQFGRGSLINETNIMGTEGYKFKLEPKLASISQTEGYSIKLKEARHPVQDFWVYDGAHPGLTDRGSIATSRDQILPDHRISEQEAVEWQRVGSKKGWMFNGKPQEADGHEGENFPTHTNDGYIHTIKNHKWTPLARSSEKQGLATRQMPAIDIENNARGIGVSGPGSGNGGMAGGYRQVNKQRLDALPIPMAKYNWTGSRLAGTGREDQGHVGSGAGGYRSGYASQYSDRPSFPVRRTTGLSRITQNAA